MGLMEEVLMLLRLGQTGVFGWMWRLPAWGRAVCPTGCEGPRLSKVTVAPLTSI